MMTSTLSTTNPAHAAFTAEIIANPDRDDVRLIYADWLEERGDPYGEFIRVQCAANKLPAADLDRWNALCHLANQLLTPEAFTSWFGSPWGNSFAVNVRTAFKVELYDYQADVTIKLTPRCGFIDEIACPCAAWLKHGPALVQVQPVTRVELAGREPEPIHGERPYCWMPVITVHERARAEIPFVVAEYLPQDSRRWYANGILLYGFADKQAALDALSAACLAYARCQPKHA